jgi:hypothetical protein
MADKTILILGGGIGGHVGANVPQMHKIGLESTGEK